MTDGREAANISFDDVTAEATIGGPGEGYKVMSSIIHRAVLAVAADALGAMESLNAQTLDYLKTRNQFGTHIGSFQALQHRMVDMFAACENTKSLLYRATCAMDSYVKRLMIANILFGDADYQQQRFSALANAGSGPAAAMAAA
jgi:alkylation response protein AidB-like acyl-CoA dehydrogenase